VDGSSGAKFLFLKQGKEKRRTCEAIVELESHWLQAFLSH
jgi:hypothetical protein